MIDNKVKDKLVYQASSPDESALVNAARYFGHVFTGRDINDNILLEINGQKIQYKLLNILEYSSDRKRMSVIVRCPDNKIRIFIKGADSIIRPRITQNKELLEYTDDCLLDFAKEGLRTLMIAYREVDDNEYERWNIQLEVRYIVIFKESSRRSNK